MRWTRPAGISDSWLRDRISDVLDYIVERTDISRGSEPVCGSRLLEKH